jgi:hypothetical protein
MDEDIIIPIAGMLMIIVLSIGVPLVLALAKKWERQAQVPKVPPDVTDRLGRMEQAIDAIAVEIERISEGQRFTTKLLSERQKDPVVLPQSRDQR